MRATPLTSTGPENLHGAADARRSDPHSIWTKRRGPVTYETPYDYAGQDPINHYDLDGLMIAGDDSGKTSSHCATACFSRAVVSFLLQLGVDPDAIPRLEVDPVRTGNGWIVREAGTTGNGNTIRLMRPTGRYPNGYIRYTDRGGGYIDPRTGKAPPGGGRTDPLTHIDLTKYKGPFRNLPFAKGWNGWRFK